MYIPKYVVINPKAYVQKVNVECIEEPAFYDEFIEQNKIVIFENSLGSFVFANMGTFDFFQTLQRWYKDCTSYVFCADGEFGYFKILESGKIVRKIASFGQINGIKSSPETRGSACSFELEKNKVFKIDENALLLVDMLKYFGKQEILELLDYYVGFDNITAVNIERVSIYELNKNH